MGSFDLFIVVTVFIVLLVAHTHLQWKWIASRKRLNQLIRDHDVSSDNRDLYVISQNRVSEAVVYLLRASRQPDEAELLELLDIDFDPEREWICIRQFKPADIIDFDSSEEKGAL
jgi:hypothetical protein